jgi:hypothetical protein
MHPPGRYCEPPLSPGRVMVAQDGRGDGWLGEHLGHDQGCRSAGRTVGLAKRVPDQEVENSGDIRRREPVASGVTGRGWFSRRMAAHPLPPGKRASQPAERLAEQCWQPIQSPQPATCSPPD